MTAIKEHPMLFTTELACAIQENRKTQTRRPCKHNTTFDRYPQLDAAVKEALEKICPYKVGDRIWVRETWQEVPDDSGGHAIHRADCEENCEPHGPWKPSIHMPRWACRLVLEITNVRVQRAHQITDADVRAEGVELHQIEKYRKLFDKRDIHAMAFGELWNEHYGKTELRWQCNPWIWAIDFRLASP